MAKRLTKKQAFRLFLCLVISSASIATALLFQFSALGSWIELKTYDMRFFFRGPLPQPGRAPVTILAIDEHSLARIPEPLVVWHKHIARVIDYLVAEGAPVIGFDLLLSESAVVDADGFQELMRALLRAADRGVPVILAYHLRGNEAELALPILVGALGADAFAYANLTTDSDDFVRRQRIWAPGEDSESRPSFGFAIANAFAHKRNRPLPAWPGDKETILVNYRDRTHFSSVSFARALEAANRGDADFFSQNFRDRMVLIGPVGGQGGEDLHPTPLYYWRNRGYPPGPARTPGVEIHANVIATLLEGNFIQELKPHLQFCITATLILLIGLLCYYLPVFLGASLSAFLVFGYLILAFSVTFQRGVVLSVVAPVAGAIQAFSLAGLTNFMLEGRQRRRIHALFKRYVNDQVIQQILEAPENIVLEGERRTITVLFADMRDFTSRAEQASPELLVSHLNRYFSAMVQSIQAHSGMVDKFIGDGIMAVFGAPLDDREAALHAVEASLEMLSALNNLNEKLASEGASPIQIGIGLDTGEAVVGNIGSSQKMEYTAIGNVVNTASRIEGLTKQLHACVLISGNTYQALNGSVPAEYVGEFALKGKERPVPLYQVTLPGSVSSSA